MRTISEWEMMNKSPELRRWLNAIDVSWGTLITSHQRPHQISALKIEFDQRGRSDWWPSSNSIFINCDGYVSLSWKTIYLYYEKFIILSPTVFQNVCMGLAFRELGIWDRLSNICRYFVKGWPRHHFADILRSSLVYGSRELLRY